MSFSRRFLSASCSFALAIALLTLWAEAARAQIRVVSYNITSSSGNGTPRSGLSTILKAIGDEQRNGASVPISVLLLQESRSSATTANSVAGLLNTLYGANIYAAGTLDGATTGAGTQSVVYNTQTIQLLGETVIGTTSITGAPRQELRYQLRPVGAGNDATFFVYNGHYKSADTSADRGRRNVEAQFVRADADALGQGAQILYTGDFNLYTSSEAAYQTLLSAGNGQAFDPINRPGSWSDNSNFRDVFTQAPSANPPSGLTGGGLDDRFDFQLFTNELFDGVGFEYINGTYGAFGNNGSVNVNGSINDPSSTALTGLSNRTEVLNLLTMVSDHLPVVADYRFVVVAAPEPGAFALLLGPAGIWGLAVVKRRVRN